MSPDNPKKPDQTLLYTFWISHFSEKARWCLDWEGVEVVERPLLPGAHMAVTSKLTGRSHVPILCHQGEVVQGSNEIVDAIPRLFGKAGLQPWNQPGREDRALRSRAEELEHMADECFGRGIQGFAYDVLLRDGKALVELWNYRGPWWGSVFYAATFPFLRRAVRRMYCPTPESISRAREQFLEGLRRTDAILQTQDHLLGAGPTRVDLAVAALLGPLVRPAQHPLKWPEFPPELDQFCKTLQDRPTIEFVRRMYREHRMSHASCRLRAG